MSQTDETPTTEEQTTDDRSRPSDASAGLTRRSALETIGATAGLLVAGQANAGIPTPRLHTDGRWLRDPDGNPVRLRGLATADPAFYRRTHPKSFPEVLRRATDEPRGWHPDIVRLPFTQDNVDYYGIDTLIEEFIRPAVDILAARDVYALVDFHLIRPYTQAATETYNEQNDAALQPIEDVMRTFWNAVAPAFADEEHVIYELFNEPTQPAMYGDDAGAWQTWRDAAQPWVDLVRGYAPETPIIIGSPRWTSVTHMAPEYPFEGENLVYAAHIYPANGTPQEFDQYYGKPANDVPVLVTEFGWDPNGGSVDQGTTSGWGRPFRDWVEGYGNMGWISWCFDDSWAPTFFESPGNGANEPWTLRDAPDQMGGFIKTWLAETRDDSVPGSPGDDSTPPPVPSNLSVSSTSRAAVTVAWEGVTDSGGSGLDHYAVFVDGTQDQTVAADTIEATVSSLSPDTSYEVGVSAVDSAGNESSRLTVSATTEADSEPPEDTETPEETDTPGGSDRIASIDPSTTSASTGDLVQFWITDESGDTTWITDLQWDLGNGSTTSGWYADVRYQSAETYTVTVTATNNEGDTSTDEVTVAVSDA